MPRHGGKLARATGNPAPLEYTLSCARRRRTHSGCSRHRPRVKSSPSEPGPLFSEHGPPKIPTAHSEHAV